MTALEDAVVFLLEVANANAITASDKADSLISREVHRYIDAIKAESESMKASLKNTQSILDSAKKIIENSPFSTERARADNYADVGPQRPERPKLQ